MWQSVQRHDYKQPGSALILTFFFIVLLTMEVALIALIAQRSLGEEGIMLSDNIQARQSLSVAMSQAERKLYSYIKQNGESNVTVDFAYGGSAAITNQSITSTDPENPGAGETMDTGVDISAWVSDRRGYWYRITAQAKIDQVELTSHKWVRVNPCNRASGTLTTLLPTTATFVQGRFAAAPDGAVYFGAEGGNAYVYSWKDGVLSILTPLLGNPGDGHTLHRSDDGRLFFTEMSSSNGKVFSWKDGVLSTLATGLYFPGFKSMRFSNGWLFFGESKVGGNFYAWNENTGLSIIVSNVTKPGYEMTYTDDTGRVLFTENILSTADPYSTLWTWKAGVLSTILSDADQRKNPTSFAAVGYPEHKLNTPDGTFIFGEPDGSNSNVYTWKNGVLSTLNSDQYSPGNHGMTVSDTGRAFWGDDGGFYTWKTGVTTTIIDKNIMPGLDYLGRESIRVGANDRVFFGEWNNPGRFFTWHEDTGLTTIGPGFPFDIPGYPQAVVVTNDNRVFFGENDTTNSSLWTWHEDTGLSAIVSGLEEPGYARGIKTFPDGRVIFGQAANPSGLWTWKDNVLMTIVDPSEGYDRIGLESLYVTDDGVAFISAWGSDITWAWTPPTSCADLGY